MVSQAFLLSIVAASAFALPLEMNENIERANRGLPPCSGTPQPCSCPVGTTFQNSTTVATIPATAADVSSITANFLQTAWFGTSPSSTTGNGYRPGATRTLLSTLPDISPAGELIASTEELTQLTACRGGSSPTFKNGFQMKFNLIDTPIDYNSTSSSGKGILGGTWDTMNVEASGHNTYWKWNIYACFSAEFDFAAFHESAMKNVTSILQSEGKTHGNIVGPTSF